MAEEQKNEEAKGAETKFVFDTDKKIATGAGAVVLLGVGLNRFKAMFGSKPQTQEEIEAGEEPEKKSVIGKIVNGIVSLATAAAGATLAYDAAKGRKFGETGYEVVGKWTAKRAGEIENGQSNEMGGRTT